MGGEIRLLWRFFRLWKSPLWALADHAVESVAGCRAMQSAASIEPQVGYCPRCGQRPDGDRRMEEARQIVDVLWKGPQQPRRADLDFALAWSYWKHKKIW